MFLDERNHPRHDLPRSAGLPRSYVIASTPRTASTALCQLLWSTGAIGAPKEYLNPTQRRDWGLRRGQQRHRLLVGPERAVLGWVPWTSTGLREHITHVQHRRSSGGWFGMKIHHHHHARIFSQRRLDDFLGPTAWIYISRTDHVAQAVSWARALQTGQWAKGEKVWGRARYSPRLIRHCLRQIEAGNRYWSAFFRHNDIQPLPVTFRQVTEQPGKTCARVFEHLGVPAPSLPLLTPNGRQGDALNEHWKQRFLTTAM